MSTAVEIIATALLFSFIMCCVVSAALQVMAWSRHSLEGVSVSVRALWRPEGYFDTIGLQQMRLARRLLALGGWAYLTYGLILVGSTVMA
jgi:hypothetical protein